MIEFILGVAAGAAFAPMWIKVWKFISSFAPVQKLISKIKDTFAKYTN